MDTNLITISLEDDSPGYKISPARVPLATLAAFAGEVRDFLKGTGKDGDADAAEVAVVSGSLSVEARYSSPSLVRDLQILSATSNTDGIDPKRRAILQRWQSAAQSVGP